MPGSKIIAYKGITYASGISLIIIIIIKRHEILPGLSYLNKIAKLLYALTIS